MKILSYWNDFWFKPAHTLRLDIVRVGLAFWLLLTYATASPDLLLLYSDNGWLPISQMQDYLDDPYRHSALYYFSADWHYWLFHGLFLAACFGMLTGFKANWCKWLVLIGHLSYVNRNPGLIYGVDGISASLLFVMCLAPLGQHLNLWRRTGRNANAKTSEWGNACLRIIQLQMAVLFFFSGIEKLQGSTWWSGDALWIALTNFEFNNVPIGWMAEVYWLVNLAVYATLLLEIAYPFLIWGKATRPFFIVGAIALHLGIAIFMGLYFFSGVMALGHLAFLRDSWLFKSPAKATGDKQQAAPPVIESKP